MKSIYLAFEGRNGSGKSTVYASIYTLLLKRFGKESVMKVVEPTFHCAAGRDIDDMQRGKMKYTDQTSALLYAANRVDLINTQVVPFLRRPNRVVISDRCFMSSLVYQNGLHMSYEKIMAMNQVRLPDMIIVLDAYTSKTIERLQARAGAKKDRDLFDSNMAGEGVRYIAAARYVNEVTQCEVAFVNASYSAQDVLEQAIHEIDHFITRWKQPLVTIESDEE